MKLHVLTAVSRPENLPRIAESLAAAATSMAETVWHWRMDLPRNEVGGQAIKNFFIDRIDDGWIWVLDDDTLVHPDVLRTVETESFFDNDAVVVSQLRTDGSILRAAPENVCVGGIDIGQAFISRELIGDHRIPENYNGDGMFLAEVLAGARVGWIDEPLSLHNAISGVNVSA